MNTEAVKIKVPLMYKGWLIKETETNGFGTKYSALNLATNVWINPLFNTWEHLKSVIDSITFY